MLYFKGKQNEGEKMDTKHCKKCNTTKSVSEFNRMARSKDGLQAYCRDCNRAKLTEWNRADGEHYSKKRVLSEARRAQKLDAMPDWANKKKLAEITKAVQMLSLNTGSTWHSGHIHPLLNDKACGLHIHSNLMPELATDNLAHGNNFRPYRIDSDGNYYELLITGDDSALWVERPRCSWNPTIGINTHELVRPYSL